MKKQMLQEIFQVLQSIKLKTIVPSLIGGAADLAPSTKTYMKDMGDFSKDNYLGRNMHFGVREIAMAAICNGITLSGLRVSGNFLCIFRLYKAYGQIVSSYENTDNICAYT